MIKLLLLWFFSVQGFSYSTQHLHKGNSPELFSYGENHVAYHLAKPKEIDVEKEQAHEEQKQCVIDLALICVKYYRLCREYYKLDMSTCEERFEKCMKTQFINLQECWAEKESNSKSSE